MKGNLRRIVAESLVAMVAISAMAPATSMAQGDSRTFPETGHTVSGKFLDYWNAHGGLAQQGYPISEPMQEVSDTDGKSYTVQYFERAVFEMHPENQPPNDVLLSLLGVFLYNQKYPNGAPDQVANAEANSRLFSETGKHVGGVFLDYWNAHGGLAQQGYPISEEFQEKSDLNGQTYRVQYFQRAVFEYHPENQAPYNVLLSQLGTFRYRAKYAQGGGAPTQVAGGPTATAVPQATQAPEPSHNVTYLGRLDDSGSPLVAPDSVAVDAQGDVYVVDTGNSRIVEFGPDGKMLAQIGSRGTDDGQFDFDEVGGLAVDAHGNVYVGDTGNSRVEVFDSTGKFLSKWGSEGTGDGQFERPEGLAIDGQGNVWVMDDRYNGQGGRLQKFDSSGHMLGKWTGFQDPALITVDGQGNVWEADYGSSQVKEIDTNGKVLATWSTRPLPNPTGIAIDSKGNILVSFAPDHASTAYYMAEFSPGGQVLVDWATKGTGPGQMEMGGGVAVDSQGNIYVADFLSYAVQKFRLP